MGSERARGRANMELGGGDADDTRPYVGPGDDNFVTPVVEVVGVGATAVDTPLLWTDNNGWSSLMARPHLLLSM
jgi:hypothetical protein